MLDASVLANALVDDGPWGRTARAHLTGDSHWVGPEHLVVEAFSAVRGRWLGGKLGDQRAVEALQSLQGAEIDAVAVVDHLPRMWELRHDVTGYDAAYIAVAEHLACPLVTVDVRLARVPGVRCDVRGAAPPDAPDGNATSG